MKNGFKIRKNILILILIIFSSAGIRYFQGQGIILSLIIVILIIVNKPKSLLDSRTLFLIGFFIFLLIVNLLINDSPFINQYVILILSITNAYLFLLSYNDIADFYTDFKQVLRIIFIHAFISILLLPVPTFSFKPEIRYYTILYIFNYTDSPFSLFPHGRITGFFWEPGLLQFFLNIYLFFCILEKEKLRNISLIILTIIFTFSTTGYILLILNFLYWLSTQKLSYKKYAIIIGIAILLSPLLISNLKSKFTGDEKSSFLVRQMNAGVAFGLISSKPVLGFGLKQASFYFDDNESYQLMTNYMDRDSIEIMGIREIGITNGLLQVAIYFGVPLFISTLLFTFYQKLIKVSGLAKLVLFLMIILTCASEPIFLTSFFLLFPISGILFKYDSNSLNLIN